MLRNAMRLVAVDEMARICGLRPGQTLSDARGLIPELQCYEREDETGLVSKIAEWCDRYTPLVALDNEGGLFLDITGCSHLFGGESQLVEDLLWRLERQGFAARATIADTPGAAWAIARYGSGHIVPPACQKEAIYPLPISALRIDSGTVDSLQRVGLKTVNCIASLPRAPLATRFGSHLLRRLDQALGREDEVISPRIPVPELSSEKRFADAITQQDDIERIIHILAQNLGNRFEARGVGARRLRLKLFRVDGEVRTLDVETASALRDPDRIVALFHERMAGLHEMLDAGFGFDLLRLEILEDAPFQTIQTDLVAPHEHNNESLHALIDRLGARLGNDRITRFAATNTHIPERSFMAVPLIHNAPATAAITQSHHAETLTRPLVLFPNPECIEAIAEVPEGPPIRFRWRKALYRVALCEGPERIAGEWWLEGRNTRSRDYFRVEDIEGYRFWLFRDGLYERETSCPDWYMHGLFA